VNIAPWHPIRTVKYKTTSKILALVEFFSLEETQTVNKQRKM
jgi:hypothetical protein